MQVTERATLIMRIAMFLVSLFLIFDTIERTENLDTYAGISCVVGLIIIVAVVFACLFSYRTPDTSKITSDITL